MIVNVVVVLVGYPRVVSSCISRVAASGWRFCGDTMWWGMLVVLFFSLEFSGIFFFLLFPPVCGFALLVLVKLCSHVSLSLQHSFTRTSKAKKKKIPGKLKRKEENNQHPPPHSITTKSPTRSSNPRNTTTYDTVVSRPAMVFGGSSFA